MKGINVLKYLIDLCIKHKDIEPALHTTMVNDKLCVVFYNLPYIYNNDNGVTIFIDDNGDYIFFFNRLPAGGFEMHDLFKYLNMREEDYNPDARINEDIIKDNIRLFFCTLMERVAYLITKI